MKFLCPSCKAKYQIADEKITGRTLRMKCRRCEYEIVIRGDQPGAELEEGSVPTPSEPPPPAAKQTSSASLGAATGATSQKRTGSTGVGPTPARRPAALATPQPLPAAPRTSARPAGSALGADFRRQMAGPAAAPEAPKGATLDAWHAAIHDVPVGPMKRDELLKKIATGAVTGESLVWREGMDDWRPLKEVAELASLLRRSAPPPAARPAAPVARPGAPLAKPATPTRPGAPAAARPAAPAPAARPAAAAAARSNVVPIGGRHGAGAAPALEDEEFDQDDEPTRVGTSPFAEELARKSSPDPAELQSLASSAIPQAPPPKAPAAKAPAPKAPAPKPEPAEPKGEASLSAMDPMLASLPPAAPTAAPAAAPTFAAAPVTPAAVSVPPPREKKGGGIPVGAWIAIAGASAFGVALAVVVGPSLVARPTTPTPVPPVAAAVTPPAPPTKAPPPAAPPAAPTPAQPPSTPAQPAPPSTPPPAPATGGAHNKVPPAHPNAAAAGTPPAQPAPPTKAGPQLTEEQRRVLAELGGGTDAPRPRPIAATDPDEDGPRRGAGSGELSAEQIQATVVRNRPRVQLCYERVARQSGVAEVIRVNVDVTIGMSGVVTRALGRGSNLPELNTCIEREVRTWRFPPSASETQTSLPFVFQPGAR